ncbi:MAG: PfkB family carbohydrate kinase [Promethearchaeota archaeon]
MNEKKYFVSLGEIMLRLSSPYHSRLFQQPTLNVNFGGGEANVAISLANFGFYSRFVSAIPANPVGNAAIRYLRGYNIDTSCILRQGYRLGIYFLEIGSGPRSSQVIYDRAHSSISEASTDDFNWDSIFKDAHWFHITGITPALSLSAANFSKKAVIEAKKRELIVSCDLNYRSKLWKYGKKPYEIMRELVNSVDIIIANEEDIQKSLNYTLEQKIGGVKLEKEKYTKLVNQVLKDYPKITHIAITLRESYSANHNDWSAMLYAKNEHKFYFSQKYQLKNIVDRVGGGDSFAAGLIYGLASKRPEQNALEFAVAASALKHTILGDANLVSVKEVEKLMEGEGHGRVQR